MLMKKINLIIFAIVIVILIFGYFNHPRPKINDGVRPYIEKFLDLIINKSFDEIYNNYLETKTVPYEEFIKGMNFISTLFGDPISYKYLNSHVGGVGYFLNYSIEFSNGKKHQCSFQFSIEEKRQVFTVKDIENFSISADFGEKAFNLNLRSGQISGGSSSTGSFSVGY